MARPGDSDRIVFEVLYYNGGPDYAPNRVIGREFVKRHNLGLAIKWAARRLLTGKGEAADAHGLYVHRLKPNTVGASIYTERTGEVVA